MIIFCKESAYEKTTHSQLTNPVVDEAARSGHVDVLEYLIEEGGDVNERTNNGRGGNPLWWAEKNEERNKEAIELLKLHGAIRLEPRFDEKKKNQEMEKEQSSKVPPVKDPPQPKQEQDN